MPRLSLRPARPRPHGSLSLPGARSQLTCRSHARPLHISGSLPTPQVVVASAAKTLADHCTGCRPAIRTNPPPPPPPGPFTPPPPHTCSYAGPLLPGTLTGATGMRLLLLCGSNNTMRTLGRPPLALRPCRLRQQPARCDHLGQRGVGVLGQGGERAAVPRHTVRPSRVWLGLVLSFEDGRDACRRRRLSQDIAHCR